MGAESKVLYVDAELVVAAVQHTQTIRYLTARNSPRGAMGENLAVSKSPAPNSAVSTVDAMPKPRDTAVRVYRTALIREATS
jgi:hypothetical protein